MFKKLIAYLGILTLLTVGIIMSYQVVIAGPQTCDQAARQCAYFCYGILEIDDCDWWGEMYWCWGWCRCGVGDDYEVECWDI